MIYFKIFVNFFTVGLFSIGGGMATLPFLYDMAAHTGWFNAADIANMLAVAESTPGALGVNLATYCGYTTAGIFGGILAALGLITPGLIIIILISRFMEHFRNSRLVQWALYGLRAASVGLIFHAFLSILAASFLPALNDGSAAVPDNFSGILSLLSEIPPSVVIFALLLLLGRFCFKNIHPAFFLLLSAPVGIIFSFAGV